MTTTNQPTYAAVITISLPGQDKTATASIVLTTSNDVTIEGQSKPLGDCTLAELQTFANNWEAEVWETYQAIKLEDLDDDEQIQVEVILMDESGDSVLEDWEERMIMLTAKPEITPPTIEETEAAESETQPDETAVAEEPVDSTAEVLPETSISAGTEETEPEPDTAVPAEVEPEPRTSRGRFRIRTGTRRKRS